MMVAVLCFKAVFLSVLFFSFRACVVMRERACVSACVLWYAFVLLLVCLLCYICLRLFLLVPKFSL